MSNHTRSNPSFERSSLTPPNNTPPARPRPTARMKPQSEGLKRRLHITHPAAPRAARRYLEEYARMDRDRDRGPERERRFRVQLDSDDAGAGPLDRDDTPYHARSSGRQRVASVTATRDSGISTRCRSRQTASLAARDRSLEPPSPAQPRRTTQDESVERQSSPDRRPLPSPRIKKRVKSAEYVNDSDRYASREDRRVKKRWRQDGSARESRPTKRRASREWPTFRSPSISPPRSPLPPIPPLPRMSPDPELPTLVELTRVADSAEMETLNLMDEEAVESEDEGGGDGAASDAGRQILEGKDDYDYDDPFINDGDLTSEEEDVSEADNLLPPSPKRSILGPAFKERSTKLKSYCLYSSDDEGLGQDRRLRRLRKGSHGKQASAVENSTPRLSLSRDKGKGKAVPVQTIVSSEDGGLSDGVPAGISDMTKQERADFKLAVAESMRPQRRTVVGESSTQGSQMSTPCAHAMFGSPSPALSTPQARTMFGTPSNSASPSTSTPLRSAVMADDIPMTMEELVRRSLPEAGASATQEAPAPPPDATSPPAEGIELLMLCTENDIPAVCGVSHPSYQDPILRPYYEGLVNLLPGHIEPWGNMAGPGFVMFQAWGEQCPRMNARMALAAINFKESGPYRNPSRCSPCGVGLYDVPGIADRYHFFCAGENPSRMIAVSCGMVEKTRLGEPPEGGFRQRWIQAIFHNQEWQRFKGFVRMVSGHDHLYCQYNKHAIQFSTRPIGNLDSSDRNGKGSWKKKQMSDGGGLRVARSKMFGSGGASEGAPNKMVVDGFSLPGEERVPVYDARTATTFDFDTDLPRLAEVLPAWSEGEIPNGSFVVVGYTLAVYRARNGNWTLGCNIHWAIVLGCSKDE